MLPIQHNVALTNLVATTKNQLRAEPVANTDATDAALQQVNTN